MIPLQQQLITEDSDVGLNLSGHRCCLTENAAQSSLVLTTATRQTSFKKANENFPTDTFLYLNMLKRLNVK